MGCLFVVIYVNNLDGNAGALISKFADDRKNGGIVNIKEDC